MATIVIRSRTKEKVSCTYLWEWSVHTFHRTMSGELITKNKRIDKHKAQELIKKHGLVEAYKTLDGEIYDTPDREFKKLFPYGIRGKEERELIERTDRI